MTLADDTPNALTHWAGPRDVDDLVVTRPVRSGMVLTGRVVLDG
jgi:hypothetical protein